MNLDDLLAHESAPNNGRRLYADATLSQEWQPNGAESTISLVTGQEINNEEVVEFIRARGGVVPDGMTAVMVSAKYNPAAWFRDKPYDHSGRQSPAVTRGAWSYQFRITRGIDQTTLTDLSTRIRNAKPRKPATTTTDQIFHFIAGDLQLGKPDGTGTQGIVDRYLDSVAEAVNEWKRLGRPEVAVWFLGDCIEGYVSQGGRTAPRLELTLTQQIELFYKLVEHTVNQFRSVPVTLIGVNGNHDQTTRQWETEASDGYATLTLKLLSQAMKQNPAAYANVTVYVPPVDEDKIVIDLGGSRFIAVHGHQFTRGKELEWWEKQEFNKHVLDAHFLLHGHQHEFQISSRRGRIRLCTPTLESESTWFKHKAGAVAIQGCLTMLTGADGYFTKLGIV
jgi:predicted phosphodiesterase